MPGFFDPAERRSRDARDAYHLQALNAILIAQGGHALGSLDDLSELPVLRKSDLVARQRKTPPFGGLSVANAAQIFQSPGPIYEPGGVSHDWWRLARFLHAAGVGPGDIVQNCFGYHMTPAGHIFENGARAVGATVFPAGTGQTELQVQAARDLGCTVYAGTPDYLKVILDAAEKMGAPLSFSKAVVSGGALFPSLRAHYSKHGITCLQCYATADLGNIAYETRADEGMIVDEGVIVEIVRPGTGDPVPEGEVGEVVVTSLNPDYPLVRFATGDLSAIASGQSACGRTNIRIKGWMGRADQTAKIKGMFVRPEQVAQLVARFEDVGKARIEVTRANEADAMHIRLETSLSDAPTYEAAVKDILKLSGTVELVPPGSLPNDGKVIDDKRDYG